MALATHPGHPLSTGDKRLVIGLRREQFTLLITNEELRQQVRA